MLSSTSSASSRNFGLDLVRATAIAMVVIAHGTQLVKSLLPADFYRLVFYLGGYFGVELFFVLSGFLIGGILLKTFCDTEEPITRSHITAFWIRRWFRTLPTYYLMLILNMTLFAYWFGPVDHDWRHFLFLQNLAWPGFSLMPESWSIAVEEWFYLSIPLVLWASVRLIADRRRAILVALCLYILLASVARLGWVYAADPAWDAGVRKIVVLRLDAIGWGCLAAYLVKFHAGWIHRQAGTLLAAGLLLVAACGVWLGHGVLSTVEAAWFKFALFSATSIGLAMTLPWFSAWRQAPARHPWWGRAVSHVSLVSYSIYLLHYSLVVPMLRHSWLAAQLNGAVLFALYLALTLVLSTLLYRFFERPMTGLRERFATRRYRPVEAR